MNYIRWFEEVGAADVGLVGGKGANLGEMVGAGLPAPPGFCLDAEAYRDFIQATGLDEAIRGILAETRHDDPADVESKTARIRRFIAEQEVPAAIVQQILDGYHRLAHKLGVTDVGGVPVAVRSSEHLTNYVGAALTPSIVSPRYTLMYFWPITNEYRAD